MCKDMCRFISNIDRVFTAKWEEDDQPVEKLQGTGFVITRKEKNDRGIDNSVLTHTDLDYLEIAD